MKGLVLGNSHVSAIRDSKPAVPGLDLQYYAVLSGAGPRLERVEDRLKPSNPENLVLTDVPEAAERGLDPRPYDFIAFCSFGLGAVRPEYQGSFLREVGLAEAMLPGDTTVTPLSRRLFLDHALPGHLDGLGARLTLSLLREVYAGPIILAPMPLPVCGLFDKDHPLRLTYGDRVPEMMSLIGQRALAYLQDLAKADPALIALGYPDAGWLAQGSTPEALVNRPHDPWHMNPTYGARVFDQIRQAAGLA